MKGCSFPEDHVGLKGQPPRIEASHRRPARIGGHVAERCGVHRDYGGGRKWAATVLKLVIYVSDVRLRKRVEV